MRRIARLFRSGDKGEKEEKKGRQDANKDKLSHARNGSRPSIAPSTSEEAQDPHADPAAAAAAAVVHEPELGEADGVDEEPQEQEEEEQEPQMEEACSERQAQGDSVRRSFSATAAGVTVGSNGRDEDLDNVLEMAGLMPEAKVARVMRALARKHASLVEPEVRRLLDLYVPLHVGLQTPSVAMEHEGLAAVSKYETLRREQLRFKDGSGNGSGRPGGDADGDAVNGDDENGSDGSGNGSKASKQRAQPQFSLESIMHALLMGNFSDGARPGSPESGKHNHHHHHALANGGMQPLSEEEELNALVKAAEEERDDTSPYNMISADNTSEARLDLNHKRVVFLQGAAGSGKSLFAWRCMQYFAEQAEQQVSEETSSAMRLPLFIDLGRVADRLRHHMGLYEKKVQRQLLVFSTGTGLGGGDHGGLGASSASAPTMSLKDQLVNAERIRLSSRFFLEQVAEALRQQGLTKLYQHVLSELDKAFGLSSGSSDALSTAASEAFSAGTWLTELQQQRFVFFLDGLDEMLSIFGANLVSPLLPGSASTPASATSATTSTTTTAAYLPAINQVLNVAAWPESVFVVNARTGFFNDSEVLQNLAPLDALSRPHAAHIQSLFLLPMNEKQCRFFLGNFASCHWDLYKWSEGVYLEAMKLLPGAEEFFTQPMLLTSLLHMLPRIFPEAASQLSSTPLGGSSRKPSVRYGANGIASATGNAAGVNPLVAYTSSHSGSSAFHPTASLPFSIAQLPKMEASLLWGAQMQAEALGRAFKRQGLCLDPLTLTVRKAHELPYAFLKVRRAEVFALAVHFWATQEALRVLGGEATGTDGDDKVAALRSSLIVRAEDVAFHTSLLRSLRFSCDDEDDEILAKQRQVLEDATAALAEILLRKDGKGKKSPLASGPLSLPFTRAVLRLDVDEQQQHKMRVSFAHKSMKEFLAAMHIARQLTNLHADHGAWAKAVEFLKAPAGTSNSEDGLRKQSQGEVALSSTSFTSIALTLLTNERTDLGVLHFCSEVVDTRVQDYMQGLGTRDIQDRPLDLSRFSLALWDLVQESRHLPELEALEKAALAAVTAATAGTSTNTSTTTTTSTPEIVKSSAPAAAVVVRRPTPDALADAMAAVPQPLVPLVVAAANSISVLNAAGLVFVGCNLSNAHIGHTAGRHGSGSQPDSAAATAPGTPASQSKHHHVRQSSLSTLGSLSTVGSTGSQGQSTAAAAIASSAMTFANLNGAVLSDCNLQGADLRNASLVGCTLERSALKNANLREVDVGQLPYLRGYTAAVCTSADGKCIISGADDRSVRIWSLAGGDCLRRLEGHAGNVLSVKATMNGKFIVSASADHTLRLWSYPNGDSLNVLQGHQGPVSCVSESADGRYIVSGSHDRTLIAWSMPEGQALYVLEGHTEKVLSVCTAPEGDVVASGSADTTVRLWNADVGQCYAILEGHTRGVSSLAMGLDGESLVSGSNDRDLRLWSMSTWECLRIFEGHVHFVTSLCMLPDGLHVASGSEDKAVCIWDLSTGDCVRRIEGHGKGVSSVCATRDGRYIISASTSDWMRVWSVSTSPAGSRVVDGHKNVVSAVAASLDGEISVSASWDGALKVWAVSSGVCLARLQPSLHDDVTLSWGSATSAPASQAPSNAASLVRRPSSRMGSSGGGEGVDGSNLGAATTDGNGQQQVTLLSGRRSSMSMGDAQTSGRRSSMAAGVAAESNGAAATTPGGGVVGGGRGPNGLPKALAVAMSLDGQHIVAGYSDGVVRVWTLASEDDGSGTASSGDGAFNGRSWQFRAFVGHSDRVTSVCISPDSRFVVSGSFDRKLRVWSLTTGDCVDVLEGHRSYVNGVCITPDGQSIFSASADQSIRAWRPAALTRSDALGPGGDASTVGNGSGPGAGSEEGGAGGAGETLDPNSREARIAARVAARQAARAAAAAGLVGAGSVADGGDLRAGGLVTRSLFSLEGHHDQVLCVSSTPDGKHIVSGSGDCTVLVWSSSGGRSTLRLEGHAGAVTSVCVTANSKPASKAGGAIDEDSEKMADDATLPSFWRVFSASNDRTVRVWDFFSGACLFVLEGHSSFVSSVCASLHGQVIITGSGDHTVRVWNGGSSAAVLSNTTMTSGSTSGGSSAADAKKAGRGAGNRDPGLSKSLLGNNNSGSAQLTRRSSVSYQGDKSSAAMPARHCSRLFGSQVRFTFKDAFFTDTTMSKGLQALLDQAKVKV